MDQLRSVGGGPGLNTKIKLLRIRRVIKGRGGNPSNLNYSIIITKNKPLNPLYLPISKENSVLRIYYVLHGMLSLKVDVHGRTLHKS